MHRHKLLAGALLGVGHFLCAAATALDFENAALMYRGEDVLDHMKRGVDDALERRQFTRTKPFPVPGQTNVAVNAGTQEAVPAATTPAGAAAPSVTPASGNASAFDPNAWEAQTAAACQAAMQKLNGQASNQAGIAVCYNLPFLDNSTGVFEAELRLYNLSAPIDQFKGVTTQQMQITLSYAGAMVQSANSTIFKRDEGEDGILMDLFERQSGATTPVVVKRYVGKINENLVGSASTDQDLKQLLIPTIDITATNPTSNQQVSTTLSSTEASFVSGIFANQTTTTNAEVSAASASALVASSTVFVVPGIDLGLFPIGLIVTLIWTVGFFLAVGLGTLGRVQFREQYRRNMKRQQAAAYRTI